MSLPYEYGLTKVDNSIMKSEKLQLKEGGEMPSEKKQILIVDDDESVCRALSLLLDTFGFEVHAFTSASEFLNSVLKHAPGCLILDVHMAGMDGFELQQKLNSNGFRIPIIFISGDKNLKFSEQYLKAPGAVGFLQKPFNDQALVDLINIGVERKGSTDRTRK
jgi:FixJ family two-component response regulator